MNSESPPDAPDEKGKESSADTPAEKPKTKADILQETLRGLREQSKSQNVPLHKLVENYFEIPTNHPDFASALARMTKLVQEVISDIKRTELSDEQKHRLQSIVAPYSGIFLITNLHQQSKGLEEGVLSDDSINQLDFVSMALDSLPKLQPSLQEEISQILDLLERAMKGIQNSALAQEVKVSIVEELLHLQLLLKFHEVFGHDELVDGTSRVLGKIVTSVRADISPEEREAVSLLKTPLHKISETLKNTVAWGKRAEWIGGRISQFMGTLDKLPPPST